MCHIPLKVAGVYEIYCNCGLSHIGQTKLSTATRMKDHIADVKDRTSTKSAVCKHGQDKFIHFLRFDRL